MQENKQEKSPIKQRILQYLTKSGISAYEFYKKSGVTRGVLSQNNGITEDNIARFLDYAPSVSLEWLLTGKGSMIKGNDAALPKAIHTTNSTDGIPLIPFSAMAGALTDERTALEYECERYVVPAFKGADFLMPIKGTSMQPTYNSGDIVACQRVPMTSIFFQWNKPYVLDTAQGPLVKRVKPGSDQNHITLVSDNPDYDPFQLPLEQVNAVALVIGLIRLE